MSGMEEAVTHVRHRIERACARAGRPSGSVTLIGATKEIPVSLIARARVAGVDHFGENYAKDLAAKAAAVDATWHFIGKLQRGTARNVAEHADVVHSAEPGGGLTALSHRASTGGREIPCLAQVDFTSRRQGEPPGRIEAFLEAVAALPGLRIVGLMTVPPLTKDPEGARVYFRRLRQLRDRLIVAWPDVRELSMGMSADFEIAVEEGATMVRVGTALFGDRPRVAADPGGLGWHPGNGT